MFGIDNHDLAMLELIHSYGYSVNDAYADFYSNKLPIELHSAIAEYEKIIKQENNYE